MWKFLKKLFVKESRWLEVLREGKPKALLNLDNVTCITLDESTITFDEEWYGINDTPEEAIAIFNQLKKELC